MYRRTPSPGQERSPGAHSPSNLDRAATIFGLGALAGAALKAFLYLRHGPFGTPFVEDIATELFAAIGYEWYGLALVSLPFFLFALWPHPPRKPISRGARGLHISLCFTSLVIGQADHETMRFMGIHLSVDYLKTYGRLGNTPTAIGQAIADDPGGGFSAYLLLALPLLFLVAAIALNGRASFGLGPLKNRTTWLSGLVCAYLAAGIAYHTIPMRPERRERITPPFFLVAHEIRNELSPRAPAGDLNATIELYQRLWKKGDPGAKWAFSDPIHPLRRTRAEPCPARETEPPLNFLVLQLETFRAVDMKLFNADLPVAPTPFLDQLGSSANSAYWPRFYCNGIPTVYTFMTLHTGMLPHSTKRVATAFSDAPIEATPDILRKKGYHTAFFSGPDPDWDNERQWLNRWYDHVMFNPAHGEKDRPLFREAAAYLKEKGTGIEPFYTTVVSITNHVPFRSPEPELNLNNSRIMAERVHNTMRYTDDVVREFYDAIKGEPWFERTVLIITGDHGYDLGDRGVFIGHSNLRHECTWVPLIVHGNWHGLPRGPQTTVGSHIDIPPTVLDLAHICDDVSFMGHSLIGADPKGGTALTIRDRNLAFETNDLSIYLPLHGNPMAFSPADPLQRTDIAPEQSTAIERYRRQSRRICDFTDYLYENNLTATGPSGPR